MTNIEFLVVLEKTQPIAFLDLIAALADNDVFKKRTNHVYRMNKTRAMLDDLTEEGMVRTEYKHARTFHSVTDLGKAKIDSILS